MLRAALHLLVSGSMIAGPPTTREYTGDDAVLGEPSAGGTTAPVPEASAADEAKTSEATPAVAPTNAAPAAEPAATPTPAVTEPEGPALDEVEDEVPYDPLIDSPEAQRARSWVRSGAVFLGIGGVLTIGAIAMSQAKVNTLDDQNACDPRADSAGNGCLEHARDRAVAALAVPGALLLLGGVAMLAAGKVQQKRLRANLRASRRELVLGLQWTF